LKAIRYILLLEFGLIFLTGCFHDDTEYQKAVQEETKIIPDQIANNIQVIFFDSASTKAVLTAARAEVFNNTSITQLKGGVKVEYFSKTTGKRLSLLTSDSATIDDKSKDMFAYGNVYVLSDSTGVTLRTQTLAWNNTKQIIYSNDFITLKTATETINGSGFESNLNLSNYKIYKVTGIKQ
jgi:LPS export ABC transporter protein LptC